MTIHSRRIVRRGVVAALVGTVACGGGDKTPTDVGAGPTVVTINGSTVSATIAATVASRTQGLKTVTNLGANSGMLFVFADDRQRAFHMVDTPTPLSIVFLDANRKVIFMADMTPNSATQYGGFNALPMRYALEVNRGWFAAHGITTGMLASFTLPTSLSIEADP